MTTGTFTDPQRAGRCRPRTPRIASRAARVAFALLCIACSATAFPRDGAALAVQRVAMIGFTVSDMDRSVSFYSDVLSFEKVADFQVTGSLYDHLQGVFGSRIRIVHMRLGDQIVELTQYVAPPDGRPIPVPSRSNDLWFEHMAIVVSDMDQAYEALQRHQVRQISPEPQTIPASNAPAAGIKAIKFRDPDNHDLELLWFPPGKGAARWHLASNRLFLGIDHTAITVGDTAASLAFYRDQLGMKVAGGSLNIGPTQEYLDNVFGARVRVTTMVPADAPPHVEFLQYETPPGGRPMPPDTQANDLWHWQTTLLVDDVQAAADALRAAGVRFVSPDVTTVSGTAWGLSGGDGPRSGRARDAAGAAMNKMAGNNGMSSIDRYLPFIARACLVLLFPFSALDKIFDYGHAVAQADASGLPVPGWLLLLLGGCLEVFGSLGILLNIYARQIALLFCFYCVVTAVLFHNFWIYPFGSADWMNNFWPFLKNFGLAGGFLFVATNARMEPIARSFTLAPRPREQGRGLRERPG